MSNPILIANRRRVLAGIGAAALAGGSGLAVSGQATADHDPGYAAYLHARTLASLLDTYRGPENAAFRALLAAALAADRTLAATPAVSLAGVHGKISMFVEWQCWAEDDDMIDALLGRSILRDLKRMTAGPSRADINERPAGRTSD